jgi:hypothetical protein
MSAWHSWPAPRVAVGAVDTGSIEAASSWYYRLRSDHLKRLLIDHGLSEVLADDRTLGSPI